MSNTINALPDSWVLIVDDVAKNLQVIGTMLRNQGYRVMPALTGPQALERAHEQPPDLILLDLMMPEMDGLEVCRRLKQDDRTSRIPVIFLTASNEMEHLVNAFQVGAVDYVTKPFNPPELLARVRTHLELKHARERLREMNDEKNEFMGIAAHDLRNPLGALKGYAELLLEEPDLSRPEQEKYLQSICNASARMIEMVQNLLDANRIESGEIGLNLAPVDLSPLVQSVIESQRSRALAKQQAIVSEIEGGTLTALVDTSVAVQVMENLLSNAIKYSPPGKRITVRLQRVNEGIRCEVADEGPGLSADDQKKLFGKFARLSAKPTGGEIATGLGLSIVKRMVEAMGGRVWCESELGLGAKFIVQLPNA